MWEAISDGRLLAILSIFEGRPSEMASHIHQLPTGLLAKPASPFTLAIPRRFC